MKRAAALRLILILTLIVACGSSETDSNSDSDSGSKITIKGTFTGGTNTAIGPIEKIFRFLMPAAYALDPDEITQVIVIIAGDPLNWSDDGFSVSSVNEGSFSIDVNADQPVGLIFANSSNRFMGYLTLADGIDSLPLNRLEDGTATIDLQALSSAGLIVSPAHNPIDNEIKLSAQEKEIITQIGGMFSLLVRNPDADGNDQIDILEHVRYCPFISYQVSAGSYSGSALTPSVNPVPSIFNSGFSFSIRYETDSTFEDNASLTAPSGTYTLPRYTNSSGNSRLACYGSDCQTTSAPSAGVYTVTYGTSILTFHIPDQSKASEDIVIMVPAIVLNGDGTINRITWTYQSPAGEINFDPGAFFDAGWGIAIQLKKQLAGQNPVMLYESSNCISLGDSEHVLKSQTVKWSDVTQVCFVYNDVYKNRYNIVFAH